MLNFCTAIDHITFGLVVSQMGHVSDFFLAFSTSYRSWAPTLFLDVDLYWQTFPAFWGYLEQKQFSCGKCLSNFTGKFRDDRLTFLARFRQILKGMLFAKLLDGVSNCPNADLFHFCQLSVWYSRNWTPIVHDLFSFVWRNVSQFSDQKKPVSFQVKTMW